MIAFFGTGLLGANFVRALLRRGETVHVWNRTEAKARALESEGAVVFTDPAEAAMGTERVHLALSDDAAVDDVLARALLGLDRRALLVDHTTTSATGTVDRVERWNQRGFRLLHAPVFMGPQNALESTGIMLVSGERTRVEAARPHLEQMTGKLVDLGERVDAAAAFKLLGNLFLMFMTTGLAEFFTLAQAMNVDPTSAAALFQHFNPGLTIGARIDRMLAGQWSTPSWELAMARKDARLMEEEATRAGSPLRVLPTIAARMDELIAEGHGMSDWTVLAKEALDRAKPKR
ncbi:MAG TPA: NAD(P)-dependent oxidoreductase [Labilithrix sp.]|nr:NAD(P)-dependent oxidoreductase [Labilithrix sp.]